MSLHYNGANSYLFVNGKKIYKFKANNRDANFSIQLCLESISNELNTIDYTKEVSLKGNVYGFSVNNSAIDKFEILSIHKYLMLRNNT